MANQPDNDHTISPRDIQNRDLDDLTEDELLSIPRTEKHLNQLRVVDLRPIARHVCGPGTWISHASKEELIYGAMNGRPPRSSHKQDRGIETTKRVDTNNDGRMTLAEAHANDMGKSMVEVVNQVTHKIIERKMGDIMSLLRKFGEELDIDVNEELSGPEGEFSTEEVKSLFRKSIQESEEAKKKAKDRADEKKSDA